MTVTVSPDNPRSVRALAVLAGADRWTKGHTKSGRAFFVIPGSQGHVYWTDTRACTCPDHRERGVACKHMLAVRLWKLEHDATAPAPTKGAERAACAVCTLPLPAGVPSGECAACSEYLAFVDGVAGVKLAAGATDRYSAIFPAED